MEKRWFPFSVALAAILAGVTYHAFIAFVRADGPIGWSNLAFFVWGATPYLVCLAIARIWQPNHGFFAALACLLGDALVYLSVFVHPQSSTAALGLLAAPISNLLIFVPVGLLVGHLNERAAKRAAL